MSLNASEFYEAGLALPPLQRKDVALRLLASLEVVDEPPVDAVWTGEIATRVADVVNGKVATIDHDAALAHLAERRAARLQK